MQNTSKHLCSLLGIQDPIIQAGMVWVSGAKLAAASSRAGILGVIGAGSMKPPLLREQIAKAQGLTPHKNLAVNVPLLYEGAKEQISLSLEMGIKTIITSAGSTKLYTEFIHSLGGVVGHVVSSPVLAKKAEDAGVDFIIAEGFEAGGHNGREELTTMVLIPAVVDCVRCPVVAAGGIADIRQVRAALVLGACGVQIGTRFIMTQESSAHELFKKAILEAPVDATMLCMKELVPVRLLKNKFYQAVAALEKNPEHTVEDLKQLLGKGRARNGMLLGDLDEGELEVGQVAGFIKNCPTVAELVATLIPPEFSIET